jgi:hypothetical protein
MSLFTFAAVEEYDQERLVRKIEHYKFARFLQAAGAFP